MAPRHGVGSRSSATLAAILRATERLLLDEGYAAVTYRGVATRAGVTPGLVQYYFPGLDELFIAVLRRGTDRAIQALDRAGGAEQPLRALWSYANDKAGSALLLEFMALANHRKAIAPVVGEGGERVRKALLDTVTRTWHRYRLDDPELTPAALVFVLSAVPRMIHLEQAFGAHTGHAEAVALVERFLDRVEPRS